MKTVRSKDGTMIAYDQTGQGPALILVAGAFSYRKFPGLLQLVDLLAPHFTVINYDRRGRGDSGDTQPYAVEREYEDLQALVDAAGGSASVWGLSSGAVLALKAAANGVNFKKMVLYEPPFWVEPGGHLPPADFGKRLEDFAANDQRAEAIRYFMTKGMGAPGFVVIMMRFMPGVWSRLKAVAHTLHYDAKLVADHSDGKPLNPAQWTSVTLPTLVMYGSKSPASLQAAAKGLANVLPNAQLRVLEGQSHNVSMKVLAPVLIEYFNN